MFGGTCFSCQRFLFEPKLNKHEQCYVKHLIAPAE